MAYLSIHELEAKYRLSGAQKSIIREAREKHEIDFQVVEEPISKIEGYDRLVIDSRIAVIKYDEDKVRRLLKI